jgi:enoyl-CoA hydratase
VSEYQYETIKAETSGDNVLTVSLNRPEARNALTPLMHRELHKLFFELGEDEEIGAVVLTGAGDHFCVGADYKEMQALNEGGGHPDGHPGLLVESAAIIRHMLAVRPPIIAAVRGYALGIGATLALFCDMVYVGEGAHIGDPHSKVGMAAGDGGAIVWPALCGVLRAKEYLMTGNMVDGVEAERIGLANYVLPDDQVIETATEMARTLAAGPSIAIRFNKRLVNKELERRVLDVFDLSLALEAITIETSDHGEAVRSFLEKRPPKFGRG